ncbi:MAG: DUF2191 domain-containing protein [Alphaproteobacteria bacterium]|jgi:hypothetical protein|nr:DUF2191 domain-containing protein [Alphaproteobacteria bacterium]MDP6517083.1 DUF2191 domain-containing protein [Alphaproteobacteria bacterium]|tara:strand:+ start:572 stop:814 length:243 start_codon:yes stop_codon:yes gene_type:complete
MRTTVRLDDGLLAEAKKHAAETNRTLTGLIEDTLREVLARRWRPRPSERIKLKTVRGTGTLPGVDLDDGAALLGLMNRDR